MAAKRSRSKKRSATSSPPEFHLFLDRALDFDRLYNALATAGEAVHRHRDHFAPDAKDYEWLPLVGHQGWVVLTKDKGMQHSEIEKTAIANANVRVFILIGGNLTGQEMAAIFVKALPTMKRIVLKYAPPFIAKIYRDSSVLKTDLV